MSHARSPGQDAAALDRRSVSPRPQRVTELSGSPPTRSPSPTRGGRNPGRVDTGSPSLSRASWHSMPGSPETSAAGSPSARSARSIRSVASRRSIASIMQDAVHELDQKAGRHALLSPGSPSRRRRSSSPVHGRTKRTVLVRNASESRILVHKAPTRHQLARGQSEIPREERELLLMPIRDDLIIANVLDRWWEEVVGKGKKTATKGDFVRCFTCIWQILTGQSKDSLKAQNIAEADWLRTVGHEKTMAADHFKDCLFNLAASWTEDTRPAVFRDFLTYLCTEYRVLNTERNNFWINDPKPYAYYQTHYVAAGDFPGPGPGHYDVGDYKPSAPSAPAYSIYSRRRLKDDEPNPDPGDSGPTAGAGRDGSDWRGPSVVFAGEPYKKRDDDEPEPPPETARHAARWLKDASYVAAACNMNLEQSLPSQRWRMRDPGARTCEHLVKVTVTGAMRKTMDQFKPLPMPRFLQRRLAAKRRRHKAAVRAVAEVARSRAQAQEEDVVSATKLELEEGQEVLMRYLDAVAANPELEDIPYLKPSPRNVLVSARAGHLRARKAHGSDAGGAGAGPATGSRGGAGNDGAGGGASVASGGSRAGDRGVERAGGSRERSSAPQGSAWRDSASERPPSCDFSTSSTPRSTTRRPAASPGQGLFEAHFGAMESPSTVEQALSRVKLSPFPFGAEQHGYLHVPPRRGLTRAHSSVLSSARSSGGDGHGSARGATSGSFVPRVRPSSAVASAGAGGGGHASNVPRPSTAGTRRSSRGSAGVPPVFKLHTDVSRQRASVRQRQAARRRAAAQRRADVAARSAAVSVPATALDEWGRRSGGRRSRSPSPVPQAQLSQSARVSADARDAIQAPRSGVEGADPSPTATGKVTAAEFAWMPPAPRRRGRSRSAGIVRIPAPSKQSSASPAGSARSRARPSSGRMSIASAASVSSRFDRDIDARVWAASASYQPAQVQGMASTLVTTGVAGRVAGGGGRGVLRKPHKDAGVLEGVVANVLEAAGVGAAHGSS